jgi:hypothetical protein
MSDRRTQRRQDAAPEVIEGMSELHYQLMSLPRVRFLRRFNKAGKCNTYYAWDGRTYGDGDRMLGKTPEEALAKYQQYESGIIGQKRPHRRFDYGPEHATLPAWAKQCFVAAKHRANAIGREFSLTTASFVALVAEADGRCQLSGIEFDTTTPGDARANPFTPSIDRIDSTQGYVEGNCRIVCLMANMLMSAWGDGPLIALAEGICRKQGLVAEGMQNGLRN